MANLPPTAYRNGRTRALVTRETINFSAAAATSSTARAERRLNKDGRHHHPELNGAGLS